MPIAISSRRSIVKNTLVVLAAMSCFTIFVAAQSPQRIGVVSGFRPGLRRAQLPLICRANSGQFDTSNGLRRCRTRSVVVAGVRLEGESEIHFDLSDGLLEGLQIDWRTSPVSVEPWVRALQSVAATLGPPNAEIGRDDTPDGHPLAYSWHLHDGVLQIGRPVRRGTDISTVTLAILWTTAGESPYRGTRP